MFKIPSINLLIDKTVGTFKRFPLTILCAIIGTGILVYLTHGNWEMPKKYFFTLGKIGMCCELGLCLFFAASLFSEAQQHSLAKKIIFQSVISALLITYYFTLSNFDTFNSVKITRYSLFIIAAHLLVSFAAFIGKNKINGFWQFNKTLFLKLLAAFLYTIVLYAGISAAFAAIDGLGIHHIGYKSYLYLWYFLIGIFNTTFFLSKIPTNTDALENDISYPNGLKSFTQFVLLPLVTLYLLILYFYFAKIISLWSLPRGYISYLIISFSVMGIFSLLLIYPIRNNGENKWIKLFSKGFYFALYPLIILLAISIFYRISEHGITADRYFILVLAAWLVAMATYFLFWKKENIQIIPMSLFAIAVLSSFGPWGAFSVSNHSQKNKLEKLLILNHILVNGKIQKTTVHTNDQYQIESIVRYLNDKNALDMIYPWLTINMDSLTEKFNSNHTKYQYFNKSDTILKYMGLYNTWNPYYNYRNNVYANTNAAPPITRIYFQAENQYKYNVKVSDFDYLSTFYSSNLDATFGSPYLKDNFFMINSDSFFITAAQKPLHYKILLNHKSIATFDLSDFLKNLKNTYKLNGTNSNGYAKVPNEKFIFDMPSDSFLFRFNFKSMSVTNENGKINVTGVEADILTKKLNLKK